jgi:general secretion pathway protein N
MIKLPAPLRLPAGLAAFLALVLLLELLPASAPVPSVGFVIGPRLAGLDDSAANAGNWATQILARPLFRADRRPVADVSAASANQPLPRLAGIIITASGRTAIFINGDGSSSALGLGGQTGAYQVQTIARDSVILLGPSGPVTLHPQFANANGNAAGSATIVPPPAAPAGRVQDNE